MKQYLEMMQNILDEGRVKSDRTGTGTLSVFGRQMRFNLQEGFPLVTTKKCHLRSIIHELLWFLSGDTNIKYLNDNGVTIWDEWADANGDLGPVYGKQWRAWKTIVRVADDPKRIGLLKAKGYKEVGTLTDGQVTRGAFLEYSHDQISTVINQLRNDPDNRRIIVSAWNVGELEHMALAPCHSFFQFYTHELTVDERLNWMEINNPELFNSALFVNDIINNDTLMQAELDSRGVPSRSLSCQLYQRSCDFFLGVPFNIASYALLVHMVAQQVNMVPGDFVWTGGDVHLYSNHLEQAKLQLTREPLPLPKLAIKRKPESIFDYKFEDFEIQNYVSHDPIKAPVAI